jgi:two-component system sensor histidine kinase ChiS
MMEMPLLMDLAHSQEPVWFADPQDASSGDLKLPGCFTNVRGIAAVKLYTAGEQRRWHAFVLFLWHGPHALTDDERYILNAISEPASTFVLGYRRHQEAIQSLARLRELDRLKDNFLYSMSHELRTPLHGIISNADLILSGLDGEVSPQVRADVSIILESGEHLLALVQDILDFAKMESGTLKLELETVSIVELATEAVRTANLQGRNIRLQLPSGLPAVLADRTRLRQVFINLLSNAGKFAPAGTIEIGGWAEGTMIVLYVRDEGIGIGPEHWQSIFEPFRQLENALTRAHGGAGLGLPITKHLIELHGGRIWIDSQIGKGATFYFSLPIMRKA